MLVEHRGKTPSVHETAFVAPNATLCGDVTIGANSQVLFGAVITAAGAAVKIDENCVIMENAVLRGTPKHPLTLGNNVLVGPHAHLTGCTVEANAFLATGCSIFTGAHIGSGAEVRINGVVHLKSTLPPNETVPIGWVAVGNPCRILSPDKHDEIWSIQKPLDFPETVFGLNRPTPGESIMPVAMSRYAASLRKHHSEDKVIEDE
jgi:carbonic anhydrase/acetyltransferase-like protein (isoleucine patch superfamily)